VSFADDSFGGSSESFPVIARFWTAGSTVNTASGASTRYAGTYTQTNVAHTGRRPTQPSKVVGAYRDDCDAITTSAAGTVSASGGSGLSREEQVRAETICLVLYVLAVADPVEDAELTDERLDQPGSGAALLLVCRSRSLPPSGRR